MFYLTSCDAKNATSYVMAAWIVLIGIFISNILQPVSTTSGSKVMTHQIS